MKSGRIHTRVAVTMVAVALTFALFAQQALATQPTSASGTFVLTSQVVTSTRTADGNTIITSTLVEIISGTYSGTITGQSTLVLHADGSGNLHGDFVCACTVAGRTGLLMYRFAGTGSGGTFTGQYRIVGSSGGLEGAHGLGAFSVTGTAGTYSGSQHYE